MTTCLENHTLEAKSLSKLREMKYKEALEEGYLQSMERDPNIFIAGIGVDYSSAVFGSTKKIIEKYKPDRIFDTPAMENALTGIAIGAAAMGKKPVIVHLRNDFMFLAMDQIINLAAKWRYMFSGNAGNVPIVVRGIIGKGWGQGATHSQSLQSVFGHFPGLNVVMPAFPQDAKGLAIAALQSDKPTIILEHRSLYETSGNVAKNWESTPIGKSNILCEGDDLTIIAMSLMSREAIVAAMALKSLGINVEVVDIRSIRPLDEETILKSVCKTGKVIVIDNSWKLYGVNSEIVALCAEKAFHALKMPVRRISWPDCPAPVSHALETNFYPGASVIAKEALEFLGKPADLVGNIDFEDNFKGPY